MQRFDWEIIWGRIYMIVLRCLEDSLRILETLQFAFSNVVQFQAMGRLYLKSPLLKIVKIK